MSIPALDGGPLVVTVCITLSDLIRILSHMNYHVKLPYATRITPTPHLLRCERFNTWRIDGFMTCGFVT